MKVGKDGKLKLSKNERQYGNFIVKNEEEFVKITDINGNLSHRVSKHLNMGKMLEIGIKEKHIEWLHNYAALVWGFSNVVTDDKFFLDIDKACADCINRHPEIYGIKKDIAQEEDSEILKEAEEVYNAIEELKEK